MNEKMDDNDWVLTKRCRTCIHTRFCRARVERQSLSEEHSSTTAINGFHFLLFFHCKFAFRIFLKVFIQLNTFTNWINEQLRSLDNPIVQDLAKDFSDGIHLISLAETLQKRPCMARVYSKRPLNNLQKLMNVETALDSLRQDGVKLVNIGNF